MSSNAVVRRLWSKEEDQVLRREVEKQCTLKNWKVISEKLPGRTNKDCRKRWSKVCEPVKKGAWSSIENERLKEAVSVHGCNWIQVAQVVQTRHADQCAKRWKHSLDPSIDHSRWTEYDDKRLLKAVERYGHNWRAIGDKEFQARSPTNIKNRHVLISRKGDRSLTSDSPSPSAQGESYNNRPDDSFDEDSEDSDEDMDDDYPPYEVANLPDSCSTNYRNNSTSTVCTRQGQQDCFGDQSASFLNSDDLFTMNSANSIFNDSSDSYLWYDHPTMTPQIQHRQPGTVEESNLTTITEDAEPNGKDQMLLDPELMLVEKEQTRNQEQRRRDSVGNRLILENVQPETVSTIVKLLFDSGANIKMRLESTETEEK